MSEHQEILASLGYTRADVQARYGLPKTRRARWWHRKDAEYVSLYENTRAAERERQAAIMYGPGGASAEPQRSGR